MSIGPGRVLPSAVTILLVAACGTPAPRQPSPAAPETFTAIDEYVERAMPAWNVPGLALAVVQDGRIVHVRGFGVREVGRPEPVDGDTVFAIASMTKPFTATAVGLLVAEGKLGWDDRVADRLPGFTMYDPFAAADLRVRDLLCHRNGYETFAGDLLWIDSGFPLDEVLRRAATIPPSWGFRYRFGYSNMMFAAAGRIIETISGVSWGDFIRSRLLEPLGMSRTTVNAAERAALNNVAAPHMEVDGSLVTLPSFDMDVLAPAGALGSSAADMARWVLLQLENGTVEGTTIVPAEVLAEQRVPNTPIPLAEADRPWAPFTRLQAYGLGWFLFDYRGRLAVAHDGGVPGMFSITVLVPEERLGVVVMCNAETALTGAVASRVIDELLGTVDIDWSAEYLRLVAEAEAQTEAEERVGEPATDAGEETETAGTPPLPLGEFAGDYVNPALGPAEIRETGGALVLAVPEHGSLDCALVPKEGAVFSCVWSDPIFEESDVTFDVEDGRAVRLRFKVRPGFIDPLEYVFVR
ncbi:MAG: serine hydrolase [Deltaproteobacteria bacterium]|nr:serine hydrolase [Deltaproteobacteria bacterium]